MSMGKRQARVGVRPDPFPFLIRSLPQDFIAQTPHYFVKVFAVVHMAGVGLLKEEISTMRLQLEAKDAELLACVMENATLKRELRASRHSAAGDTPGLADATYVCTQYRMYVHYRIY